MIVRLDVECEEDQASHVEHKLRDAMLSKGMPGYNGYKFNTFQLKEPSDASDLSEREHSI